MKKQDIDTFPLIVAIIGFIAFFLPWIGGGFIGEHSGYHLLSYGREVNVNEAWLLILLPISFAIVAVSKTGLLKTINPAILKIIELIPIALIMIATYKLLSFLGLNINDVDNLGKDIFKIFKIGFLLTLIASVLIAFAPNDRQTPPI